MFGKIAEMKKAMEAVKLRLDTITVQGTAGSGQVKVEMSGNMEVRNIDINSDLLSASRKEELEELLSVAVNQAVTASRNVSESELKAAGRGILPDIPGLF